MRPRGAAAPGRLKRERLYVLPGDSPLGLRLPLASLPDVLPEDVEQEIRGRSVRDARRAASGAAALAKRKTKPAAKPGRACAERRDQDGVVRRSAQRPSQRVHAAADAPRGLCGAPRPASRPTAAECAAAGRDRGLYAAARSAHPGAQRDAGSRRDRGQRASGVVVGRALSPSRRRCTRKRGSRAPVDREIHARRPAHGHRGRQSRDAGRSDGRRQSASAPAGPPAKPGHLLAEPSGAVVPVLGDVHRTDEPVAACRRSARRPALRARDRVPANAAQEPRQGSRRPRRGSSTGCCAIC